MSKVLSGIFNPNKRRRFLHDYMNKLVADEYILEKLLKDMKFKDFIAITHEVVTKLEHLRS